MAIVSLRRRVIFAWLLGLLLVPSLGHGHRLPPEVVAFFKVDEAAGGGSGSGTLHTVVRVPTAILLDARLPMVQITLLDLQNIDAALQRVALEVARSMDVTDGGRPQSPQRVEWMLSLLGDRSFASYESAAARFSAPRVPVDTLVYWNEAYVDVRFDYPLVNVSAQVTARLNGLRMGGEFFQTKATYMPFAGAPRTVTVIGSPQRVSFEPSMGEAVLTLLRRGVDQLSNQRLLWLFLLCLAIPNRKLDQTLRTCAAFAMTLFVAMSVVTALSLPLSDELLLTVRFVTAAFVMLAAVQAFVGSSVVWSTAVAGLCGLGAGALLGSALHELRPLAGSHALVAVAAFGLVVTGCLASLVTVLTSLVRLPYRLSAPPWLVTASLCALPAHEAAHSLVDVASQLATRQPWDLAAPLAWLIAHWPTLLLLLLLITVWVISRSARPLVLEQTLDRALGQTPEQRSGALS